MRTLQTLVVGDHVAVRALLSFQAIVTVTIELRRRSVEAEEHLLAGFVSGLLNRAHDQIQRLGI